MNKSLLFALIGVSSLSFAQEKNKQLEKQLENDRIQTQTQYEFYLNNLKNQLSGKDQPSFERKLNSKKDSIIANEIRNQANIAFFFDGRPYYFKQNDTHQLNNTNVDLVTDGTSNGLQRDFKGDGINIAVFDGGRVYEKHLDFGGENSKRIRNKEAESVKYNSHATGVSGMIGAIGHDLRPKGSTEAVGNTRGVLPNSTIDAYSFQTTTLPNDTTPKNSLQKLLGSLANISNHSYGGTAGWDPTPTRSGFIFYVWRGEYNPTTKRAYNLSGSYTRQDKYYDDIVYYNPSMIVVKAAGNSFGDGPEQEDDLKVYFDDYGTPILFDDAEDVIPENNCAQGFDCLDPDSSSKNLIIVGATEKITANNERYTQASDVVKASYSGAGPRDDGAIKPDITSVGSGVFYPSTQENTTGSDSWAMSSGTSFSSPNITGIIGLWTEIKQHLFNNQKFNAASAKALLIHSAQEAGNKGPDVWYGWGFANAKKGAEILVDKSNNKAIFEDKTLQNKAKDTFLVESDGSAPLKATIVWTDPSYKNIPRTTEEAYNNRTSRLVNDLDLRITNVQTNEVYYPWKLDINNPMNEALKGDNTVDNVEQVLIENPKPGIYKVEVSHKGNLVNNEVPAETSPQDYSIITTGYKKVVNDDIYNEDEFNIFPTLITQNDAYKDITISLSNKKKTIESISVYDMSGKLLKTESVKNNFHKLDISSYVAGVYIVNVKLSSTSETITRKILKR